MKFCSQCGGALEHVVPEGDDRERARCPACGTVHYENPRTIVGCLVEHVAGGRARVLLCRRAIEPGKNLWTLPAGFLELDEGAVAGARRETREEALAEVDVQAPHAFLDLPHIGQTYALFRARLVGGRHGAGQETRETRLYELADVPWDELAFPGVNCALELYAADRRAGVARLHHGVLHWNGRGDKFAWANYELREHIAVELAHGDLVPDAPGGPNLPDRDAPLSDGPRAR